MLVIIDKIKTTFIKKKQAPYSTRFGHHALTLNARICHKSTPYFSCKQLPVFTVIK